MQIINAGDRGTITRNRNVWNIRNALIEEVPINRRADYIIVSYAVRSRNDLILVETLRLNISRNTIIRNHSGRPMLLRELRPGMWIDAWFSPIRTGWRLPAQANALRIVAGQRRRPPCPPRPPAQTVRVDRIVGVDRVNSFLITGVPRDINRQMRFVITNETIILNRNGGRIALHMLRTGQTVRIRHADFLTMSIPPQTTAFHVQLL